MSGRLSLVGTPIGNREDLSARARRTILQADVLFCEDTRSPSRLLPDVRSLPPRVSCHRDNERARIPRLLSELSAGRHVVYLAEAGMPAVSDPGSVLVRAAVEAGHPVAVVPGPSALSAAAALSGFDGTGLLFLGFAPRKGPKRRGILGRVATSPDPVVLFEAAARVPRLLADLCEACPDPTIRKVVVLRELTKHHESVLRGSLADLASNLADEAVRGEVTIVVGPVSGSVPDPARTAATAVFDLLIEADLPPGRLARKIAALTGRSAEAIYRRLVGRDGWTQEG